MSDPKRKTDRCETASGMPADLVVCNENRRVLQRAFLAGRLEIGVHGGPMTQQVRNVVVQHAPHLAHGASLPGLLAPAVAGRIGKLRENLQCLRTEARRPAACRAGNALQSTPPASSPKLTRPPRSTGLPHSAQASNVGMCPRTSSASSSKRSTSNGVGVSPVARPSSVFLGGVEQERDEDRSRRSDRRAARRRSNPRRGKPGRPRGTEAALELGFREQIEGVGRFAQEHDLAGGEQIEGRFERPLRPASPLGQAADFAELARQQRDDAARLAPLHDAEHQGCGFFGGHGVGARGAERVLAERVASDAAKWLSGGFYFTRSSGGRGRNGPGAALGLPHPGLLRGCKIVVAGQVQCAVDHVQQQLVGGLPAEARGRCEGPSRR